MAKKKVIRKARKAAAKVKGVETGKKVTPPVLPADAE